MAVNNLSPSQVRDLIHHYESELDKLNFQATKVNEILKELQTMADVAEGTTPAAIAQANVQQLPAAKTKAKGKRGGKAPAASEKTNGADKSTAKPKASTEKKAATTRKPKQRKAATKKPRTVRLSEWDNFVIKSIREKQKAMITADLIEVAKAGPYAKLQEDEIKSKINRSLQKLANRNSILERVKHDGRGFAYVPQEWMTKKGDLPKKYAR